jgi:hypothetical protein
VAEKTFVYYEVPAGVGVVCLDDEGISYVSGKTTHYMENWLAWEENGEEIFIPFSRIWKVVSRED